MPILFAGGELSDFERGGAPTQDTSGGGTSYSTGYARSCIAMVASADRITAIFPAVSEFYASYRSSLPGTQAIAGTAGVSFGPNALTAYVRITATNTNTDYNRTVQYWNGSSWVTAGTFNSTNLLATHTIGIKIGASGFIKVWLDGVLQLDVAIDFTGFGYTTLAAMTLRSWTTAANHRVSEVIIGDEDTRLMRLLSHWPTADGANTAWTGTFADVDENGLNTADYISSATANQVETFVMTDVDATALGSRVIKAVVLSASLRKGSTGPQNVDGIARLGGTDYDVGALNPTQDRTTKQVIMANNPATAGAWDKSTIDGMELGVKSIA